MLAAVYGEVDGKLPALRANEAAWTKLLKSVRTVVQSTPLWKLQTIADTQMDFLYPSIGRGSTITLRPGIVFCLRRFHGLVGNLVRGAWVDCDDLNDFDSNGVKSNGLHYTEEGYVLLGRRYARQAKSLIHRKQPAADGRPE